MDQPWIRINNVRIFHSQSVFMRTPTFVAICLALSMWSVAGGNSETDRLSLLAVKSQITQDPLGILNSWNASSHFCMWTGITCGARHKRVTVLDLSSNKLKGKLSPHLGNLSFLRRLTLSNNTFTHYIPREIGGLFRLRELNLANNSFSGELPRDISNCSSLQILSLGADNLTGKLPGDIGSLSKLEVLDLGLNKLVGEIPNSFGNLSSLKWFSLHNKNFGL